MTTTKYLVRINRVPTADATTGVSGFSEIQVRRFCQWWGRRPLRVFPQQPRPEWAQCALGHRLMYRMRYISIDCRVEININVPSSLLCASSSRRPCITYQNEKHVAYRSSGRNTRTTLFLAARPPEWAHKAAELW